MGRCGEGSCSFEEYGSLLEDGAVRVTCPVKRVSALAQTAAPDGKVCDSCSPSSSTPTDVFTLPEYVCMWQPSESSFKLLSFNGKTSLVECKVCRKPFACVC